MINHTMMNDHTLKEYSLPFSWWNDRGVIAIPGSSITMKNTPTPQCEERLPITFYPVCMEAICPDDLMEEQNTSLQPKTRTTRRRHRVTFSLDPSLALPLEKYRSSGGTPSRLASRLLCLYFDGEIAQPGQGLNFSFLRDQIAEKTAEINRLSTLVEKVVREDEEQKRKANSRIERQRDAIQKEFADAIPHPVLWKRNIRMDGLDPVDVIRRRAEALSERFGVPAAAVWKMMQEVIPGVMEGV